MDKILVVDDEAAIVDLIATILGDDGLNVLTASDGLEALTIAHEEHPQLVLTDVMMPDMGGPGLCLQLRGDPSASAMVVLLMSAAIVTEPSGCGEDGVIRKPFDLDVLVEAVHRHLIAA